MYGKDAVFEIFCDLSNIRASKVSGSCNFVALCCMLVLKHGLLAHVAVQRFGVFRLQLCCLYCDAL
jgi:hypothetical protein